MIDDSWHPYGGNYHLSSTSLSSIFAYAAFIVIDWGNIFLIYDKSSVKDHSEELFPMAGK